MIGGSFICGVGAWLVVTASPDLILQADEIGDWQRRALPWSRACRPEGAGWWFPAKPGRAGCRSGHAGTEHLAGTQWAQLEGRLGHGLAAEEVEREGAEEGWDAVLAQQMQFNQLWHRARELRLQQLHLGARGACGLQGTVPHQCCCPPSPQPLGGPVCCPLLTPPRPAGAGKALWPPVAGPS